MWNIRFPRTNRSKKKTNYLIRRFIATEVQDTFDMINMNMANIKNKSFSDAQFSYLHKLINERNIESETEKFFLFDYKRDVLSRAIKKYEYLYRNKSILRILKLSFDGSEISYVYLFDKYMFKFNQYLTLVPVKIFGINR